MRVELVDRAVGLDPRMRLGHPAHVAQVGLAAVAQARVDAGQVDGHRRAVYARTSATITPFKVGGDGKPVRIRRGPATVTGDVSRKQPLADHASAGKAPLIGPGARRPASDHQAESPRGKGWPSMKRSSILALGGASLVLAVAPAAALAAKVSVRIEGASKTLQAAKTIRRPTARSPSSGRPRAPARPPVLSERSTPRPTASGRAPSAPASTSSSSPRSWARPPAARPAYWGIWVSKMRVGRVEIKLHAGDQPVRSRHDKGHGHPLRSARATRAGAFTVKVVSFSGKGEAKPLAGVPRQGRPGHQQAGIATVTGPGTGKRQADVPGA